MPTPILATKLYIPPPRPNVVPRPRLIERLNHGLLSGRKLTLISAPAGFGKTTLVSEWIHTVGTCHDTPLREPKVCAAWLSLDENDNEPTRFLAYLIAALQTIEANVGKGALSALQAPQPPSAESILTALLNEIATIPDRFILILDDYHTIEPRPADASRSIDAALTFLLDHLPPQMHLGLAAREDPHLPLARYRARDQLTELRVADLRFTPAETAEFLNTHVGLNLSAEDIAALETRTEGWIAGLQLASLALQGTLSMRGHQDTASFIQSFTGSHHFVLDYLVEEVLHQQSENVQAFLLLTSILDRMCGPLCDAVRFGSAETPALDLATSGQETLEYLERANLFIVPLDNERHWYRYHHLFAGFLRQRLRQNLTSEAIAEHHIRASQWYEDNDLVLKAFLHAATANDVERAKRLIEEGRMPLHSRSTVAPILDWLASLPTTVLDAKPSLRVKFATLSLVAGQTTGVEESLQAAEAALQMQQQGGKLVPSAVEEPDDETRNLIGIIAAARATLALTRYQAETIIVQAHRALEYLRPDNLTFRFTAMWTLGFAHYLQGDRAAAIWAYTEAVSISQASGDTWSTILATSGLGEVQELENQLYQAAETYQCVLRLAGDHPQPNIGEDHLGLARILYEWNDLDGAEQHGQKSLQLTRQYDSVIDRFIISEIFLARLKLAQGDVAGAAALLAKTGQTVRERNFVHRMPEVAAAQALTLLRQGNLSAAADLAEKHALPLSQARVHLVQGDAAAALAILDPLRREMEAKGWQDERLKVMVLQAVALYAAALRADGEKGKATQVLADALALAEPGGFVRTFVDEGPPMAQLLSEAADQGIMPEYTGKLLAAFRDEAKKHQGESLHPPSPLSPGVRPLIEPLTPREREVLQLLAAGCSNPEIAEQLVIAVTTVKTHVKNIYGKLQVANRFQAIARAQDLNLL
ncbi:MAG: LuxR C-terminal-related transcriptional regulator [Anaerolineae bacterium]|jgi:LuxR family maltose regulon positive regulatory protein